MTTEQELHTMQLAAIMTACSQNTDATVKDRITPDNPYWTVAYQDVCAAIDREMRWRKRAEEADAKLNQTLERIALSLKSAPPSAQVGGGEC